MPSYMNYKKTLDEFSEEDHPRDEKGRFTDGGVSSLGEAMQSIMSGETSMPSRRVEAAVNKINLPKEEAVKCALEIEKYTANPNNVDVELIDKAIYNSASYNKQTYSGIEKEHNNEFNVGDTISGRLISWSKKEDVATTFAAESKKILVINQNPGLDISDMSYENDEHEVLTASTMKFVVKDITTSESGIDVITVEYNKQ